MAIYYIYIYISIQYIMYIIYSIYRIFGICSDLAFIFGLNLAVRFLVMGNQKLHKINFRKSRKFQNLLKCHAHFFVNTR